MILNTIDGTPLTDADYRVLTQYLTRHVFMEFMDSGRDGMRRGCENAVDTLVKFSEHVRERNNKVAKSFCLHARDHKSLVDEMVFYVTDGFVTRGADGIKSGIVTMYSPICDAMREVVG